MRSAHRADSRGCPNQKLYEKLHKFKSESKCFHPFGCANPAAARQRSSPSIEDMADQSVGEFRLEPRGLGRHDLVRVRDRHEIFHASRAEGECGGHLAGVDALLQLCEAASAADEVDALV